MLKYKYKPDKEGIKNHLQSKPIPKEDKTNYLEKFNTFYDDSSDEENTTKNHHAYDIQSSWQAFSSTSKNLQNNLFLSFVAHAAGLKILYSSKITRKYYAEKANILSSKNELESAHLQLQKLFIKNIEVSLEETIAYLKEFMKISAINSTQQKLFTRHLMRTKLKFKNQLNEFVADHCDLLIQILEFKNTEKKIEKKALFTYFILLLVNKLILIYKDKHSINENDTKDDHALELILTELTQIKVGEILENINISNKYHTEGRMQAIEILKNYKSDFKCLIKALKKMLVECQGNGYVKNMLAKKLKDPAAVDLLTYAYLQDVMKNFKKESGSELTEIEIDFFTQYFAVTDENIISQLHKHFTMQLEFHISNVEHKFCRRSLGKNHLFVCQNPYTFYSNILLSNRSQKRRLLNLQHAIFKDDRVERSWRLSEDHEPESDVIEKQEISVNSARIDKTEGLGNYEKVFDMIDRIKYYFFTKQQTINDAQIAKWIRLIFQGQAFSCALPKIDQDILLNKLQSLVYLLFGSEVVRNPAMLVLNQMLLDLIIENKHFTFDQAFLIPTNNNEESHIMPMAVKGAVPAARALEARYQDYMPYPYYYPGPKENDRNNHQTIDDLIKAEAKIFKAWIDMKKSAKLEKGISTKQPQILLAAIEEEMIHWFGQEPKETNSLKCK